MGRSRDFDEKAFGYGVGYVNNVSATLKYEDPEAYQIINRGIGGNRVVDLYARIKADVWNHTPDLISILIGINDVWHEIHGKNGVELDRFERVYRMMIEDTKKVLPNVKFIICEPFVLKGEATEEWFEQFSEIRKYAAVIKNLAKEYGIPFYMYVPTSTIDLATPTGAEIEIEERKGEEIDKMWYEKPMAPEGIKTFNPAFDVTDNKYITAVITEKGIVYPPYDINLRKIKENE